MTPRLTPTLLLTLAVAATPLFASGQRATTPTGDPGERLYRTYCATCHGVTGRGDGPMASQLRAVPTDLTTFAARNGGVFPSERLREIIDGRGIRAHGVDEMPVWGDAFRSGPDGLTQQAALARIAAIVKYLQTLQVAKT